MNAIAWKLAGQSLLLAPAECVVDETSRPAKAQWRAIGRVLLIHVPFPTGGLEETGTSFGCEAKLMFRDSPMTREMNTEKQKAVSGLFLKRPFARI